MANAFDAAVVAAVKHSLHKHGTVDRASLDRLRAFAEEIPPAAEGPDEPS